MISLKPNFAAVDLGSNSFRVLIGRVDDSPTGAQFFPVDTLREPVRLAAGLGADKKLDAAAWNRGLDALRRFGERLRDFPPHSVRCVATNTLRVARNAGDFLVEAERVLGFPIEVIAGREEARLIYIGASHDAPACTGNRLVVDIGGGSTEFVIGQGYQPQLMESLYIGCVSHNRQFFPNNDVDEYSMKQAVLAARREIQVLAKTYKSYGWNQAIGSSGTARALAELLEMNQLNPVNMPHGITLEGLQKLQKVLIKAENTGRAKLVGLKPDRIPVLAGGLSIMSAVFAELDLTQMDVTDGALRLGVLYDLLGRQQHEDMRTITVEQFMRRYLIDKQQAQRLKTVACQLLSQFPEPKKELREDNLLLLGWAADLHEIGLSISHSSYHKHSAYIASNADMPGLSKSDQTRLATLLLGHTGKLGKLNIATQFIDWRMLLCLRIAYLLCRNRNDEALPEMFISENKHGFSLSISAQWLRTHSLVEYSLQQETKEWEKLGRHFQVIPV